MNGSSRPSRETMTLAAILLLGLLARVAVMAPAWDQPPDDPDHYLPLARSLVEGAGFSFQGRPTAYRPPLYPITLMPAVAFGGDWPLPWVFGLHLALGAGTIALTYLAARRWGFARLGRLLAPAVVAFDPVLVVQGRAVMTETLAAFLVAATLSVLGPTMSWRALTLGGIGFGLGTLCRPSLLPAVPLVAFGLWAVGPGGRSARLGRALGLCLVTVLTLAPWAIRNRLVFGEAVWTTTHGGYTLALANNPVYYQDVLHGPPGAVWEGANQRAWFEAMNRTAAEMTEPQADRHFQGLALDQLKNRPADFARASLARLSRFWGVAPSQRVYPGPLRLLTAAWTLPFWILVVMGLFRRSTWRWPRVIGPCLILALTAVHALYWTDMRMRAPIVPALALVATGWLGVRSEEPSS